MRAGMEAAIVAEGRIIMRIRVFIALQPPPEWIAGLSELQNRLRSAVRSAVFKWVDPENIHVTLRFLGWVLPEELEKVRQAIAEAAKNTRSFTLATGQLGCFPSLRRARVLWLGVGGEVAELSGLNREIQRLTSDLGEPAEDRPFAAHLTLARVKEIDRESSLRLERGIAESNAPELRWRVREVLLMRSHLSAAGARYEAIASAPLQGAKPD